MPSLEKLLSKFTKEERGVLEFSIGKIISLNWRGLDIKKLKGYADVFRLRKGDMRIIFSKDGDSISLIAIERRRENIYKKL